LVVLSRKISNSSLIFFTPSDEAIRVAGKSGFTQNEALANERVGKFFHERDDIEWASFYLDRAHKLYKRWGARAKADQLEARYGDFVEDKTTVVSFSVGGVLGRSKFSSKSAELHRDRDLVALGKAHKDTSSYADGESPRT